MPGKITSAVEILLALAAIIGAVAILVVLHYQLTIDPLSDALMQCKYISQQQAVTIASQKAGITALQHKQA